MYDRISEFGVLRKCKGCANLLLTSSLTSADTLVGFWRHGW